MARPGPNKGSKRPAAAAAPRGRGHGRAKRPRGASPLATMVAPADAAAESQPQPPVQPRAQPGRPPSAAALWRVVALLAAHETDLSDLLLGLCKPRHVAAHKRELPQHREVPLGTFAVTVPKATANIAKEAFKGCSSLTEITLPPNLTNNGGIAFCGCTSLIDIALPPKLTEIGGYAFYRCISLTAAKDMHL